MVLYKIIFNRNSISCKLLTFFAKSLSAKSNKYFHNTCSTHETFNSDTKSVNNSVAVSKCSNLNQLPDQLNYSDILENFVLKPCNSDISQFVPSLRPTYNLASYVDQSQNLQELLKLGVNLHKLEKKKGISELLLSLNFEDIKKYILFLNDCGVSADKLGYFLTKNPFILKEDMDYLEVRIEYLRQKKFSPWMIARVVEHNPYWLLFSTERIDRRLGHFQSRFSLSGNEVRSLAVAQPRLITYKMETIKLNTFALTEEMGFNQEEIKILLLKRPKLWMIDQVKLNKIFSFVNNEMNIAHEFIVKMPEVLFCRESRLKERHKFLLKLHRAQYDPTKENYVSLKDIVSGTDSEFCINIAKSTPAIFNAFLKTL